MKNRMSKLEYFSSLSNSVRPIPKTPMRRLLHTSGLLLFLLFLAPLALHAQDSALVRTAGFGVSLGISSYSFQNKEVPVHPTHGTSFEGGVNWLFPMGKQGFIKLGMEFTDYRSPFNNDTSYYDIWYQFPVLFRIDDLARFGPHSRLVLSLGPRFSFLMEQGVAGISDEHYAMRSSSFFGIYKTGIASELAVYNRLSSGDVQSFGIRGSADLPGWSARLGSDELVIKDQYVNLTLFYCLTFGN